MVAILDHLHQVAPLLDGELRRRTVIENEQPDLRDPRQQAGVLAVDPRHRELVEQPRSRWCCTEKPSRAARLPRAQAIQLLPMPVGPRIRILLCCWSHCPLDSVRIRARSRAPGRPVVDILQARRLAQSGEAQALGERGVLPVDLLAVDQDAEPLVEVGFEKGPAPVGPPARLHGREAARQDTFGDRGSVGTLSDADAGWLEVVHRDGSHPRTVLEE